jgi:hypothetical protein
MKNAMRQRRETFRGWRFALVRTGSNRLVVLLGPIAVKLARSAHGRKACLLEREIWAYYAGRPGNGDLLCPILWSDPKGRAVVMRTAGPVPAHRRAEWLALCDAWQFHRGEGDFPDPSERSLANWGIVGGRIVMTDYGNVKPL